LHHVLQFVWCSISYECFRLELIIICYFLMLFLSRWCFNFSVWWALTWIFEASKAVKALKLHGFCQCRYVTFPALANAQLLLHFCVVFVTSHLHLLQYKNLYVFMRFAVCFFAENNVINIMFHVLKLKFLFRFYCYSPIHFCQLVDIFYWKFDIHHYKLQYFCRQFFHFSLIIIRSCM
jgi:hypothetical protein